MRVISLVIDEFKGDFVNRAAFVSVQGLVGGNGVHEFVTHLAEFEDAANNSERTVVCDVDEMQAEWVLRAVDVMLRWAVIMELRQLELFVPDHNMPGVFNRPAYSVGVVHANCFAVLVMTADFWVVFA